MNLRLLQANISEGMERENLQTASSHGFASYKHLTSNRNNFDHDKLIDKFILGKKSIYINYNLKLFITLNVSKNAEKRRLSVT